MPSYELTYLISPNLTETEIKNFQEKMSSLIQKKGVLVDIQLPRKRRLFYPIKKTHLAFLGTLNFQMESENLADFEKNLKSESCLLRYLLLSKIKPKPEKLARRPIIFGKKIEKPKKKKVEIEKLEEKLKEVLGES
jgi:ribosomal protein S6